MSRVVGQAGGSLDGATWAVSQEAAAHGKRGEQLTAAVLAKLGSHAVVFHDLSVPGTSANIDHVVVYGGNKVLPIDSKCWKPGFYWTLKSRTRRGFTRLPSAEKNPRSAAKLRKMLTGTRAVVVEPITVIWPSSTSKPQRLALLTLPEGRAVPGRALPRFLSSRVHNIGRPADPEIVRRLTLYVRQRH